MNVGNDGKIADLSYATLDQMIERLNTNPALMFEIQTSAALITASISQDLEMFKLSAVRNYLLEKGVSSDRILLSANSSAISQTGTAQVYISLNLDDSNTNIASTPTQVTTPQASATTNNVPIPLAVNPADSANLRLATVFTFLLTNEGNTVTALLRAMGISTTERSGFAINPDQLSNLKN